MLRTYNYIYPADPAHPEIGADRKVLFYAACLLSIDGKVCVDLWTMRESRPTSGITVRNRTDARLDVVLGGCEIHNGPQTVVIDDGEDGRKFDPKATAAENDLARRERPGPFEAVIAARDIARRHFSNRARPFPR